MRKKITILVTAAGGNLGRCMVHYLNTLPVEIIAADVSAEFLCAPKSSKRYVVPRADSPNYFKALNAIIKKNKVDMVLFESDIEIKLVSAYPEKVAARVWLPDHDSVVLMQDKFKCNQLWGRAHVPVPHSRIVRNIKDLADNIWLRPLHVVGGGGKMATHAKKRTEAEEWISLHRGETFTMNEYLPGRIFGFDSVWKEGKLIGYGLKERLKYVPISQAGAEVSTSIVRTSEEKRPVEIGIAAIRALTPKPDGVFSVDMKENSRGVPCVTEINPGRFLTTSLLLFAETGYHLPFDYINLALGKSVRTRKPYAKERSLYFIKGATRLLEKKDLVIENAKDL